MDIVFKDKKAVCIFMAPALLLFAGIVVFPIIMSAYYSFFHWDGITDAVFAGVSNYVELFKSKSASFPRTLGNAFLLAGLSVFVQLPISLFLALVLARGIRGEKFFVALFFTPVLMSTVVIGQLWMKVYHPEYGIINTLLRNLGLNQLAHVWLGEKSTALASVFIPILWQYIGYHMLLFYAGIKSVSPELREAAKIDGANEIQIARCIIIPLLKPVIRVSTIFAVTGSLKAFDLIYVLTNGGPAHASEVPSTLMVSMIFGRGRYGFGSSIALFIIFICFFFAIIIEKCFNGRLVRANGKN